MKRFSFTLGLLLAACSSTAPPDAAMDAQQTPESSVDATADAVQTDAADASLCSPACPAAYVCAERRPGQWLCEVGPDSGTCPPGWFYCFGRCWNDVNLHCGACGSACSAGQTCAATDGGFACQ